MQHHRYTDEEFQKIYLFTDTNEDESNGAARDNDESEDESDDFHKYDDVDRANVDIDDTISESNEKLNENSENDRPTFNRTYDKNASDVEDIGKDDGTITI